MIYYYIINLYPLLMTYTLTKMIADEVIKQLLTEDFDTTFALFLIMIDHSRTVHKLKHQVSV